jgi:DNA polymerase-1
MNNNAVFIDGHNFLFKSYAVPFSFSSKKGTQLQVVSTFLNLVRRAIKATNSLHVAIVFDSEQATDNHLNYAEYKANRTYDYSTVEMSPFDHLPLIKQALSLAKLTWTELPGTEADDIIATYAVNFLNEKKDNRAYIASTDTDFLQLVNDRCLILSLHAKGEHSIIDRKQITSKYGVPPEKYVELKSWVGDKADNITGIAGIGWKRGAEIVNGMRTRALSNEEQLLYNRNLQLITLNQTVKVPLQLSDVEGISARNNTVLFEEAGF